MKTLLVSPEKKKVLLLGPLLFLPFITLIFYSLGGGAGASQAAALDSSALGLNYQLPRIHVEDPVDKLAFYQKAKLDSMAALKKRPPLDTAHLASRHQHERMLSSLAQLEHLSRSKAESRPFTPLRPPSEPALTLELPPRPVKESAFIPDPEIAQLEQLLDKVLAIQKNELGSDSLTSPEQPSPKQHALGDDLVDTTNQASGFFGLIEPPAPPSKKRISAIIDQSQRIRPGAKLRIRLLESLQSKHWQLAKDEQLWATVLVKEERLMLEIKGPSPQEHLIAYDLEGQLGLALPTTSAKASLLSPASRVSQQLMLSSLPPGLSSQLAQTGLYTARGLLQSRSKAVKVKAGTLFQLHLGAH